MVCNFQIWFRISKYGLEFFNTTMIDLPDLNFLNNRGYSFKNMEQKGIRRIRIVRGLISSKLQISNFKSRTSNLEPRISNLKSRTSNLEPRTSNTKPQTPNTKLQTPNTKHLYYNSWIIISNLYSIRLCEFYKYIIWYIVSIVRICIDHTRN